MCLEEQRENVYPFDSESLDNERVTYLLVFHEQRVNSLDTYNTIRPGSYGEDLALSPRLTDDKSDIAS